MALFRRGSIWWIDYTDASGQRIRQTAGTKNRVQAQEFHDELKAESWRIAKTGQKPKYSWEQAAHKWLITMEHKKTHLEDVTKIAWLQQFFKGKMLNEITRDEVLRIGEIKKSQTSDATANRHLALIRSILRKAAAEWEWIDRVPQVKLYKESKRRVRWITSEQVKRLLFELPLHQRDLVLFSLGTGLRQSNVLKLKWSQVDWDRRSVLIPADQAKGGSDIHVPLSASSLEVIAGQVGKHREFVFTFNGKPIANANTRAWRKALVRAEIQDFRWHDLRHTWASWHIQNGTPLFDLQELGGWKSEGMVRRYAHLAPEQLAKHAERVGKILDGTKSAQ
jgi:integrase